MKKFIITFSFLALFAGIFPSTASAYKVYTGKVTPGERNTSTIRSWGYRPFQYRAQRRSNTRTSNLPTTTTRRASTRKNYSRYNRYTRRPSTTRTSRYPSRSQSYRSSYNTSQNQSSARVFVNPQPQRQPLESLSNATIDVMEVGVRHESGRRSSLYFQEAFVVDSMRFQMYAQSGIARDPEDFELVIEDQSVPFERDGSVNIQLKNARVTSGDSLSFSVGVRFRDPDLISHENGNFRLRLMEANVIKETSFQSVPVRIVGQANSQVVAFQPTLGISGGGGTGVFTTVPTNDIFSSSLQAGQKATVMALGLGAQYDDLSIESLTLRNTTSGSLIDNLVDKVEAVDAKTGEILGSTRFIGGKAEFDFIPQVYIRRNARRDLAFVVHVADTLPTQSGNASFTLDVGPADIDVRSVSTGNNVVIGSGHISVRKNTYLVVNAAVSVTTNNQPDWLNTSGSFGSLFRFQVHNPGSKEISLGRVTFGLYPTGVSYPGGISPDDFELRRLVNGREVSNVSFVATSASGQTVTFDSTDEVYVDPGRTAEFVLKAKLENVGGTQGDSVGVQVLGDTSYGGGTLGGLRTSGANFIWSDHSGRPHVSGSSDWFNGYLMNGVPSQTIGIRR